MKAVDVMYDVIIVGAGPIGLYTAKLCEEKGIKALVLEEDEAIGKPDHCSGLISTNLNDFVKIDKSWIDHKVNGAVIYSGGKNKSGISLKKPTTAAYVINREMFDHHLSRGLKSKIIMKSKVFSVKINNDFAEVFTDGTEGSTSHRAKLVIGCDGVNSIVAKQLGSRPNEFVKGIILLTKEKNTDDFVEMWFDKNSTKDGFLWKIPRGKTTEYGMMSSDANFAELEKYFKIKPSVILKRKASMIPIGPRKTYFNRAILIGDAAAQVKPWSGGGVVYGLTCAKIAVDVIKDALQKNDFSENALEIYENRWKNAIGKNIVAGLMFREFYKESSPEEIEKIFNLMKKCNINFLDMDFPVLGFL